MMLFPHSRSGDGAVFLRKVQRLIDRRDLDLLASEAGFSDPNNFPFAKVRQVLAHHAYPTEDLLGYGWAIQECGIDRLATFSPPVRAFAASIYLYCHKVAEFDGNFESGFLHSLVAGEVAGEIPSCTREVMLLLEWLHEHVGNDRGTTEYYPLLAWFFLSILTGVRDRARFAAVLARLRSMKLSSDELRALHDCVVPQADDWLALVDRIPAGGEADVEALTEIVCGWME